MLEQTKADQLHDIITKLESVAVAFSGGADSTLLLAFSLKVLKPDHVLAITADTPTLPRSELAEAATLARELGAQHLVVQTDEMHNERFTANTPDRCYYCKQELFSKMREVAGQRGYMHLVYGATADDVGDYRPGMRAASDAGAIAPLLKAGFTKKDVRELSRQLGLRTWDKPAMACLSSRFPYGTPIRLEDLTRVEQAEYYLRHDIGLRQVRVRDQETVARIEVDSEDLLRLVQDPLRSQLIARFKSLGYTYVTLNLEGFRSDSLNDVLPETQRTALH